MPDRDVPARDARTPDRADDPAGQVVLVTGGGRGLGRALTERLLQLGARVATCSRTGTDLQELERDAPADALLTMACDVADARAMERFADAAAERFGRVDGLVINASVLDDRVPLRDVEPDDWRRVIDVNLTGAFNACRAAIPHMRRAGGGSIIAVSSGVGDRPRARWGTYAVSKWALEGLARNLALEESDAGIRVNVVDPGAMRTGMRRAAYPGEDPDSLPLPGEHLAVYLWLLGASSGGVSGERFVAREWRSPR
ncbi:MAG TPA: SDR family NAD(P)-dependent oxidoreductase [Longimicrobiales bacterium]